MYILTEDEGDRAHELFNQLWVELHDHVDARLDGESDPVSEAVRQQLTEQMRYWRRMHHGR